MQKSPSLGSVRSVFMYEEQGSPKHVKKNNKYKKHSMVLNCFEICRRNDRVEFNFYGFNLKDEILEKFSK